MPSIIKDSQAASIPDQRTAATIAVENRRLETGAAGPLSGQSASVPLAAESADRGTLVDSAELLTLSAHLAMMPVQLSVAVPIREFRVRQLLTLLKGDVLRTIWGHGEDLPLISGDVQLAWTEFEVTDSRLGVRVTRLG